MRSTRAVSRFDQQLERIMRRQEQELNPKEEEVKKPKPKIMFDERGLIKIRLSLCDQIKELLRTKKRTLFYQRVFIVAKNVNVPSHISVDVDASQESLICGDVDFKEAFEQRFRKLMAACYKMRIIDDPITGLYVYMGDFSLLIIEATDVMIGDILREFNKIAHQWFERARVFLVEDNIDNNYFKSFITRRAVAPFVNEKFPTNTPNDFLLMSEHHLLVREKLLLLCETLSRQLYEIPVFIEEEVLPEEEELGFEDEFEMREEEEADEEEYEEDSMEVVRKSRKIDAGDTEEDQLAADEGKEGGEAKVEDEAAKTDDADADAPPKDAEKKSSIPKPTEDDEEDEDESDEEERGSEEDDDEDRPAGAKAKAAAYKGEEEMEEEEEAEEEETIEEPFEEMDEEKFLEEIEGIDMFQLESEPPFKIEAAEPKTKALDVKESTDTFSEDPLAHLKVDPDDEPFYPEDMLPPAEYIKILPEIQRLEFILDSDRYYQTLEKYTLTYTAVPVQVDDETLLWPPEYDFIPVNVFKRGPYDVNLTFGDYSFDDDEHKKNKKKCKTDGDGEGEEDIDEEECGEEEEDENA